MFPVGLAIAIALYSAGFYFLIHKPYPKEESRRRLVWTGSLGLVLIWHSGLIARALSTWSGDSFYSLSLMQRGGLLLWSALMIFVLLKLSDLKTRCIRDLFKTDRNLVLLPSLIDLSMTLILFESIYAITPQLYYFYYQLVMPGLPGQWIVPIPFSFTTSMARLIMHSVHRFSDLLAGLTVWWLLLIVIWHYLSIKKTGRVGAVLCATGFGLASLVLNDWSNY